MIDHGEQPEGYVLLSHTRAARLRVWDNLEKAYQEQLVISGRVLGRVKGGLGGGRGHQGVHAGLAGRSAPGAQPGFVGRPGYSGQDHQAEPPPRQRGGLAQAGRGGRNPRAQDAPRWIICTKARWSPAWSRISPNTAPSSTWAASTACCTSPIFPTAASTHPSEVLHVGDEITVKVLKFDRAKERVSLGMKQLGARSLGDRGRALPGEQPRDRPGGERHRLRRFRGTRTRRRRPDPHQRNDLVAAHEASLEGGQARRPGGGRGARSASQATGAFRSA